MRRRIRSRNGGSGWVVPWRGHCSVSRNGRERGATRQPPSRRGEARILRRQGGRKICALRIRDESASPAVGVRASPRRRSNCARKHQMTPLPFRANSPDAQRKGTERPDCALDGTERWRFSAPSLASTVISAPAGTLRRIRDSRSSKRQLRPRIAPPSTRVHPALAAGAQAGAAEGYGATPSGARADAAPPPPTWNCSTSPAS